MRRFIYLDTDTINSYLAQIYDGLVLENEQEIQKQDGMIKQNTHNLGGEANAELKVFGKGLEGKLEYTYEHLKETNNLELIRDIQTKLLHDNAFEQLMIYLKNDQMISEDCRTIGNFVEIEDDFFILNLDYYSELYKKDGFIDKIKRIQHDSIKEEIENQTESLSREQSRNKNVRQIIKEKVKDAIEENDKQHEYVKLVIDLLTAIVPYRQMLYISNYLVAINPQYVRDDMNMLSFKYGGRIKMVGYITNKIYDKENYQSPISAFSTVGNSINNMMKLFFDNKDELYIVHPIAIFYE